MAKGGHKREREVKIDKCSLPRVQELMKMHLLLEMGVAYTSFMTVMRPLSLFPPPYCHYAS
jgi:hypothetical protein